MSATGKEYQLAIRIAGVIDKTFTSSLAAAKSGMQSLKKTIAAMDQDFTKLDRGFDAIMGVGKTAFRAIASAATVAATAVAAVSTAAVNVGMEFEKQMSAVKAISGASADEIAQLTDKARELGKTSVFSATEVGKAMEYMGMAGWKTEQMLAGIEGVLNLAAASGEDLSVVADIVTDDLTAFHMEAEETARMVDVMAQAAMNSNTNVEMMGETFKYAGTVAGAMGYQIEDIAIATGLMASSGIKASNAGTALRNIITRMAKPTKESAEAMEALGLSLEKDDGTMYSFLEIMKQMRKGMAGMTETQKAYYAAELAGQRGMPALLAIANSTDRQFNELTEAIYNAEGAALQMADIRLDNLAGDVQIFTDSLTDAGIELSQELNGPLRGLVQMGTEFVDGATTQIPKAVNKISAEFPTLQRKFKKFAQPVISGFLDGGKWIIRHGNGIISVLAGIGAALAAYKTASSLVHIIKAILSLASLNPGTCGILGVVSAIGILVSALAAYKQYEKELVNQSLADHFGTITLSMKELQKVAEYIVSSESLGGVKKALEAFQDLDGISATMQDAVSEIDRLNWKISIGMELTEDENEAYKQAIDTYVKAAQDYALQSQYAVSLNLQIAFAEDDLEGQSVVAKVSRFYQDKYDELSSLGTQLNDAITDAFNDGLLDIKETKVIADIQRQMAEIEEALATGEFEAQLSVIGMEYAGGGSLTADSFQNLQEELARQVAEASSAYQESYVKNYAAIQATYEAGDYLNEAEYQKALESLQGQYLENVSAIQAKAINFQLETIMNQYAGELDPAIQEYMQRIREAFDDSMGTEAYDWINRPGVLWLDKIFLPLEDTGLDKTSKKAIAQLLESISPSIRQTQEYLQQFEDLGMEIPEALQEGLSNFALLDTLSQAGLNSDSFGRVLGEQLFNSEFYDSFYKGIIEKLQDLGQVDLAVPEGLIRGLNHAEAIEAAENAHSSEGANVRLPVNEKYHFLPIQADNNAKGGIIQNRELSWLAENGPEAVIPLDGSRNAISLWEKAGQLMGMRNRFDGLDLGGGANYTIEFSPTYQFYGEAPSKQDMVDAARISQEEFDQKMDQYLKTHRRVSFG
ncbi:MAG: phage tail tape measure protein [bacterium]|nr:phage tail tape measure protein [bacterium]